MQKLSPKSSSLVLPVSMEDEQLFPRQRLATATPPNKHSIKPNHLFMMIKLAVASLTVGMKHDDQEMLSTMSKLWWSRLVIACRGYICNHCQGDGDDTLWIFDDLFIMLHNKLVGGTTDEAMQVISDIGVVYNVGLERLAELASGFQLPESQHPFYAAESKLACRRLFGLPSTQTYIRAYKQSVASNYFFECLLKLSERWEARSMKKKSIRFEEDPEWQPDDRVVMFEQFYQGNRTWVLMDFDRHILRHHQPRGVSVIFGDRYLQSKLNDGYRLCARCGMLEQMHEQFASCPDAACAVCYCSSECLNLDLHRHAGTHNTGSKHSQHTPQPYTTRVSIDSH